MLAVTLTVKLLVAVNPVLSVTCKRTVPVVAVQLAATVAVIVPPVLVIEPSVTPVAVPPAMTATLSVPAASSIYLR